MNSDTDSGYYTVDVMAGVLNVTPRRIQQLAAAGIIPRAERGRYPLADCIIGYVKYLQAELTEPVRGTEENKARLALLKERHRALKLDNDARAKQMIPYAHADAMLTEISMASIAEAERLCDDDELVATLAAADQPALIRATLIDAVREMRQRTADYLGELGAHA